VHEKIKRNSNLWNLGYNLVQKFCLPFPQYKLKTEKYEAVISPLFLVDMKPGPSHEETAERKT